MSKLKIKIILAAIVVLSAVTVFAIMKTPPICCDWKMLGLDYEKDHVCVFHAHPVPIDINTNKMVLLELELPEFVFGGTGENHDVENLDYKFGQAPQPPAFYVPEGTENVALSKPVTTSSVTPLLIGSVDQITDGDKGGSDGSWVELDPFAQHITIDLGQSYDIYAIACWHYHKQARAYFDVIIQTADDPDFTTNVKTHFNNDIDNSQGLGVGTDKNYFDTNKGKLFDVKVTPGRYVRLYSDGNSSNDLNHFIEVEVYGRAPAE